MEYSRPDRRPSSTLPPTLARPGKRPNLLPPRLAPLARSRPGLFCRNRAVVCLHPSPRTSLRSHSQLRLGPESGLEAEASGPCYLMPAMPTHTHSIGMCRCKVTHRPRMQTPTCTDSPRSRVLSSFAKSRRERPRDAMEGSLRNLSLTWTHSITLGL